MVEDVVVRVRLAGGFSVTVGARVLGEAAWPGRQGRLVLAYLACHGDRPVPRSELVELVWPAGPPRSAATALSVLVSSLRSTLAEAGLTDPISCRAGCYRLRPRARVDIQDAERAAGAAEAAWVNGAAQQALDVADTAIQTARQLVLPGIDREWVEARRRGQRVVLVRGLQVRIEACLRLRDPRAAAAAAQDLLAVDPLNETGYRAVIRACAALGRRGEALRAYEACRTALADELGIDPSSETEAAARAALRADAPDPPEQRLPLPGLLLEHHPDRFVARAAELAALHTMLGDDAASASPWSPVTRASARPGCCTSSDGPPMRP